MFRRSCCPETNGVNSTTATTSTLVGGSEGAAPRRVRRPRLRHRGRPRLALGDDRGVRRHRADQRRRAVYLRGTAARDGARPYDFPGDPELAHAIASEADAHGTWITAIDDPYLPIFYATTNLWEYLGQRPADKRWVSIGVCQTADTEDNLRLGRALGDAIAEVDRKVVLIASGALSHTFWPLRELREHEAAGVEHIFTPEAAAADCRTAGMVRAAATTPACWRPCRSSTGSSRRPGSAIT